LNGIHLLGDAYGSRCEEFLLESVEPLREKCIALCVEAGLTVMADWFYQFEGGGVTGAVVLAESHLAIHTWPEVKSVTLDIYVCNYTEDNSAKARKLFDSAIAMLKPEHVLRQEVNRGELEALRDGSSI
jgi:spermidine synthase